MNRLDDKVKKARLPLHLKTKFKEKRKLAFLRFIDSIWVALYFARNRLCQQS